MVARVLLTVPQIQTYGQPTGTGYLIMTKKILKIQMKIMKTWQKLLKAETKRNEEKVAKLEAKLMNLELEAKEFK